MIDLDTATEDELQAKIDRLRAEIATLTPAQAARAKSLRGDIGKLEAALPAARSRDAEAARVSRGEE